MNINKEIVKPKPQIQFKLWELIIAFHQIYGFLTNYNGTYSSLELSLSLFIVKYFYEGARTATLFLIISFLGLCIIKYFEFAGFFFQIMQLGLLILPFLGQIYFPFYKIPNSTGEFKVGYKEFRLNDKFSTLVSVFYPTIDQKAYPDAKWAKQDFFQTWTLSVSANPPWYLKLIFRFLLSFTSCQNMGVLKNAPIIEKSLKVVIFSHGFSAHKNSYTCFTKDLASQGYVVFCPEHYEPITLKGYREIENSGEKLQFLRQNRCKHLEDRKDQICHLMNEVSDKKFVQEIFGIQNVDLETSGFILMGHSFGGVSALYSTIKVQENNIKAVIGLDPWLFPMEDKYLLSQVKVPVLFITSHTFDERVQEYEIRKRNLKFFINQKQNDFNKVIGFLRFTDHISPSDVPFFIPREATLLKMINFPHLIEQAVVLNRELIKIFLQKIVYPLEELDSLSTENFIEDFSDFCEEKYQIRDFFADEILYYGDSFQNEPKQ